MGSQATAVRWLAAVIAAVVLFDIVGMAVISDDRRPPRQTQRRFSTTTEVPQALEPEPTTVAPVIPPVSLAAPEPPLVADKTRYTGPVTSITGRVVDGNGRPVSGAHVALAEHIGIIEGFGRMLAMVASFGLYCSGGRNAPVECRDSGQATTGADGRYTIRLLAGIEEVQQAGDFDLAATAAGSTTTIKLDRIAAANYGAPDLRLWHADLKITGGQATWRRPPEAAKQTLRFVAGDKTALSVTGEGSATFEPRILEDFNGAAEVVAESGKTRWSAPTVLYQGPGVPPSRGKPCTVSSSDGKQPPKQYAPCPATDTDDFSHTESHPGRELVVDLGASRSVSLAVVRGFPGDFFIDVSLDGKAWTPAMHYKGETYGDVKLARAESPRQARYVRMRIEEWNFWFLERLSIW